MALFIGYRSSPAIVAYLIPGRRRHGTARFLRRAARSHAVTGFLIPAALLLPYA